MKQIFGILFVIGIVLSTFPSALAETSDPVTTTRLNQVVLSFIAGDFGNMFFHMFLSMFDIWYQPNVAFFSIFFSHGLFAFVLFLILGSVISKKKIIPERKSLVKFLLYCIILPIIVIFITLLLPSV